MPFASSASRLESQPRDYKYLMSFISGGLAGMVSKTMVAPFDRIKILFQVSNRAFSYKESIKEGVSVYTSQGVKGLFKGNNATLVRVFPYAAIQFAAFDIFQAIISRPDHTGFQRNINNFIAGSLAGIAATAVTYPAEFLRTRMAMDVCKFGRKSLTESAVYIYKREGIRAFYGGVWPSLVGIIPCNGIAFFMFFYLKHEVQALYPQWKPNRITDFAFGAFSGCFAQFIAYPFDIVRKRLQAQNILLERGEIKSKMGMAKWARHILAIEGMRGMYKGFTMHFVKAPLASGSCFTVKNALHKLLDPGFKH